MPGRHSFEAAFARRARRYRLSNTIGIGLMVAFALGVLAAAKLPIPETARMYLALFSTALVPLAVIMHIFNLRLRCPSCGRRLTPANGRYCPQCGAEEFQAGSGWCDGCHSRIEEESGDDKRSYRVRGCTHCGVFLDRHGL